MMQCKKSLVIAKPAKSRTKPSLDEIKQILRDNLSKLSEEYRIRSLWLFGSYVRGDQHKRSDLDVLVEFEEVPTLPKFIALERCLRDLTGFKVDLVFLHALKGENGERILRERVTV